MLLRSLNFFLDPLFRPLLSFGGDPIYFRFDFARVVFCLFQDILSLLFYSRTILLSFNYNLVGFFICFCPDYLSFPICIFKNVFGLLFYCDGLFLCFSDNFVGVLIGLRLDFLCFLLSCPYFSLNLLFCSLFCFGSNSIYFCFDLACSILCLIKYILRLLSYCCSILLGFGCNFVGIFICLCLYCLCFLLCPLKYALCLLFCRYDRFFCRLWLLWLWRCRGVCFCGADNTRLISVLLERIGDAGLVWWQRSSFGTPSSRATTPSFGRCLL
jgi:hypothetical protein